MFFPYARGKFLKSNKSNIFPMKNSDKIPPTLSMVFDTSEPKKTRTKTSK